MLNQQREMSFILGLTFYKVGYMESVILKVENNLVKVLSVNKNYVLHIFNCNDCSIKGILSQFNKEQIKYDLEYYVEDIKILK